MLTFKGFKKKEKISKRTLQRLGVAAMVLAGTVTVMVGADHALTTKMATQKFEGVKVVDPNDENIRDQSDLEKKYDTDLYEYTLSDREKEELKEKGFTDEQITSSDPDDLVKDLYGTESYLQNRYMDRFPSAKKSAREPSESERKELLESMARSYYIHDFSNVVSQFQNALEKYSFCDFKDEPICSLYSDASRRIDQSLFDPDADHTKDIDQNENVNHREQYQYFLQNRKSALGTLLDTMTLPADIVAPTIADSSSCLPFFPLQSIENVQVIDPRAEKEYQYQDKIQQDCDLAYIYSVTDMQGNKADVIIEDHKLIKTIRGVYYSDKDLCVMKSAMA